MTIVVQCRRCGRTLMHPKSRKYGIGPTCSEKEKLEAVAKQAAEAVAYQEREAASRIVDVGPLGPPILTVRVAAPPPRRSDC